MTNPTAAFAAEMQQIYHEAAKLGYRATYFFQLLERDGALETARRLLHNQDQAYGISVLWEKQRLDLTVESVVLKPAYAALFSAEERQIARQRLAAVGYRAPWDSTGGA